MALPRLTTTAKHTVEGSSAALGDLSASPASVRDAVWTLLREHQEGDEDDPFHVPLVAVHPADDFPANPSEPDDRLADAVLAVPGQLLVWEADLTPGNRRPLLDEVGAAIGGQVDLGDMVTPRVRRLLLGPRPGLDAGRVLLTALRAAAGAGYRASFNHGPVCNVGQMSVKGNRSPARVEYDSGSFEAAAARDHGVGRGAGVTVAVLDTGTDYELSDPRAGRTDAVLAGVVEDPDLATYPPATHRRIWRRRPAPSGGARWPHWSAGHGTAVAGIVRMKAPAATVRVQRVASLGVASEVAVAQAILAAAREADVINISIGTPALPEHVPLAIEDALAHLPPRVLVVASAGNHGGFAKLYPAAFDRVIAVGALGFDGEPLPWSSRGDHLSVSARGVVVAPYIPERNSPPRGRNRNPFAAYCGTSFSCAVVSGALAALLSNGIAPYQAMDALVANGDLLADFGTAVHLWQQ